MLKKLVLIMCLVGCLQTSFATVKIQAIRVAQDSVKTRIVFELSERADYKNFSLSNPDRLVLDMQNTRLATRLSAVDLSQTMIEGIRAGKTSHANLRVVLDLRQTAKAKTIELAETPKKSYRLVIDFYPQTLAKPVKAQTSIITAADHAVPKYLTVVIDPGHGGKDPGATGRRGTHEKDVVLSIAQNLQKDLQKTPGIKVCMTRKGDYFVSLRGRLAIARKCHGDIFIAIHADAFHNTHFRGASVFALSQRGATSESARWLATSENQSEMLGGNIDLSDKGHLLSSVLIDLSQTATINSSLQLGAAVIKQLSYVTKMHSYKVEQAAFVVLKSPDIPSILIETGFLSNYQEEANLCSPAYRARLAFGISQAILNYFKLTPVSKGKKQNKRSNE